MVSDNSSSPLKPTTNVKSVTKTETQTAASNTTNTGTASQAENDIPKPDERYKYFLRIKIGGKSSSETDTNSTTTASSTFTSSIVAQTSSKTESTPSTTEKDKKEVTNSKPQSPETNLSKTKDGFGFGNPFAPNSQWKFESSLDLSTFKPQEKTLESVASNMPIESKEPGEKVGFSFLAPPSEITSNDPNLPNTARELIFDSLKGEILGQPYYRSSSDQHSTMMLTLYDPEDEFRPQIAKLDEVEVEAGFVNGFKRNLFMGKILKVGRKLPDGTIIEAVDKSYLMQSTTTGVNPSVPNNQNASSVTDNEDDYVVKSTFSGEAGVQINEPANKKQVKLDPNKLVALHKTLPPKTMLRVINPKNKKKVIVEVIGNISNNGGKIIEISTAIGKALEIGNAATISIEGEVLEKKKTEKKDTDASTDKTTSADKSIQANSSNPTSNNLVSTGIKVNSDFQFASGDQLFNRQSNAEMFTKEIEGLRFSETSVSNLSKQGEIIFQQSKMASAEMEAIMTGKKLTARGNTLFSVAPGEGASSGVILDYSTNKATFIDYPSIVKRTSLSLQPSVGSLTVQGWDVTNKQTIGATVVTPGEVKQHPTGIIQPPEWKSIKLSDPIIPGSPYTWSDATRNGSRVPQSKEIMAGIIRIATIITELTKETKQSKWRINSWYRPPEVNRSQGGSSRSRHMSGDAVDFYFDESQGFYEFYRKMADTWAGGVALGKRPKFQPPFIHLDARHLVGGARARWFY